MVEGLLRVLQRKKVFEDEQGLLKKVYETKSGLLEGRMDSPKTNSQYLNQVLFPRMLWMVRFR